MLFNSIEFGVFLVIVFTVYWFVLNRNLKIQNIFLIAVSYLFYGWWDWRFLFLLVASSLVDFTTAFYMDRTDLPSKRKFLMGISMCLNLGLLGTFKYFNFFYDSFTELSRALGLQVNEYSIKVILPVGISFYTFQTLSYVIDVYRRKLKASDNLISFMAYVSFFPQLVAGPIERATNILPQFARKRTFSYAQATDGMRLILWGFFKKIVVADNCALFVNDVFRNYQHASGVELIFGAILFAFQIYCDFSGYSDIAIGTAKLFGFELMINFRAPYFSRDIGEFWRRWHISLSTWFRDYLYFTMGGSKGSRNMVIRNTLIVFFVSGLWHGANWTYVVWGGLNGLYFLPLLWTNNRHGYQDVVGGDSNLPSLKELWQMVLTFTLVTLAWVFFRASSVTMAVDYLRRMFTAEPLPSNFSRFRYVLIMAVAVWFVIEWLVRRGSFDQELRKLKHTNTRMAIYFLLVLLLGLWGAFNESEFIYFQF